MSDMPVSRAFWARSEQYFASKQEAHKKAENLGLWKKATIHWKMVDIEARLERGYLGYKRVGAGLKERSLIRVDPGLQDVLARAVGKVAPALAEAFDRNLGQLAHDAFDAWPVSTGLSKAFITLEYEVTDDDFRGMVECRVPYVPFISGQPFRKFIGSKGWSVASKIGEVALADLGRKLEAA